MHKIEDQTIRVIKKDIEGNYFYLQLSIRDEAKVIDLTFYSIKGILSTLGGLFTVLITISTYLITPLLYHFYNRSILSEIKKEIDGSPFDDLDDNRLRQILKEKVDLIQIYNLFDIVEDVKEDYLSS
jgi:hypothetical protein